MYTQRHFLNIGLDYFLLAWLSQTFGGLDISLPDIHTTDMADRIVHSTWMSLTEHKALTMQRHSMQFFSDPDIFLWMQGLQTGAQNLERGNDFRERHGYSQVRFWGPFEWGPVDRSICHFTMKIFLNKIWEGAEIAGPGGGYGWGPRFLSAGAPPSLPNRHIFNPCPAWAIFQIYLTISENIAYNIFCSNVSSATQLPSKQTYSPMHHRQVNSWINIYSILNSCQPMLILCYSCIKCKTIATSINP